MSRRSYFRRFDERIPGKNIGYNCIKVNDICEKMILAMKNSHNQLEV
jgi:hypothetical protein